MQLPVDVKALLDETTNITAARETPLSVSVYIDDAASMDLIAHVRSAFASSLPSVRMTASYLDSSFVPYPEDDIAVIVASAAKKIGAAAAAIRAAGVPVMVTTVSPTALSEMAAAGKHPIPEADIVTPCKVGEAVEPFAFDDDAAAALDERMGRWIVSVCREKRLAFAIAFPFMRRPLARDAIQATSVQNAGVGLVPFIPGADLPIMTLNQAKMVLQIAAAYGHEMNKDRAKELAFVVGGAYVSRTLVRELTEFIPVLGFAIRTGVAYGATTAVGNAVLEYYEGGEDATGVANVLERATQFGAKTVAMAQEKAPALADSLKNLPDNLPTIIDSVAVSLGAAADRIPGFVDSLNTAMEGVPVVSDALGAVQDKVPVLVKVLGGAK